MAVSLTILLDIEVIWKYYSQEYRDNINVLVRQERQRAYIMNVGGVWSCTTAFLQGTYFVITQMPSGTGNYWDQ